MPAPLGRSRHGDSQPGSLHGGGAESALAGDAVRARSGGPAHAGADSFHQPALQRPAGHRSRGFRPVADYRRGAGDAADAGRGASGGDRRPGPRPPGASRPEAIQTPRDVAHRLRRHHSRAEPPHCHHADFLPGRRDSGGRPAGGLAETSRPAGHSPRRRRPSGAIRRAGHGKARRPRAELFQRHRPDLSLPRRRPHRRPAAHHQRANSSTTSPANCCGC